MHRFCRTDPSAGPKGISAFICHTDDPGFRLGKVEHKMGIRGSPTNEVVLEDCRIPADRLLGSEGEGFKIAMATLDKSRPGIAAQALGLRKERSILRRAICKSELHSANRSRSNKVCNG